VAVVFATQAAATATLSFTGRDTTAAVVGVIAFGLGFGVATIAKPVLLTDRYGTRKLMLILLHLVPDRMVVRMWAAALHRYALTQATYTDGHAHATRPPPHVVNRVRGSHSVAASKSAQVPHSLAARRARRRTDMPRSVPSIPRAVTGRSRGVGLPGGASSDRHAAARRSPVGPVRTVRVGPGEAVRIPI
jgi:hypothetical protein